jgi:hypothetical protein
MAHTIVHFYEVVVYKYVRSYIRMHVTYIYEQYLYRFSRLFNLFLEIDLDRYVRNESKKLEINY